MHGNYQDLLNIPLWHVENICPISWNSPLRRIPPAAKHAKSIESLIFKHLCSSQKYLWFEIEAGTIYVPFTTHNMRHRLVISLFGYTVALTRLHSVLHHPNNSRHSPSSQMPFNPMGRRPAGNESLLCQRDNDRFAIGIPSGIMAMVHHISILLLDPSLGRIITIFTSSDGIDAINPS